MKDYQNIGPKVRVEKYLTESSLKHYLDGMMSGGISRFMIGK